MRAIACSMFTGPELSRQLGLDRSRKIRVSELSNPRQRIYIQGISCSRKLSLGTLFMYEIIELSHA